MPHKHAQERGAWQLGFWALLGLFAFVVVLSALVVVPVVIRLERLPRSDTPSNTSLAVASILVRFAYFVMGALALASYAFVSFKAPRPQQLHIYGLALALNLVQSAMSIAPENLEAAGHYLPAWISTASLLPLWAFYKYVLYQAMIKKLAVMGSPASRCQQVQFWGHLMIASIVTSAFFTMLAWSVVIVLFSRGVRVADIRVASADVELAEGSTVPLEGWVVLTALKPLSAIGPTGYVVTAPTFILTTYRLMRSVLAALSARGTEKASLTRVRRVLRRHFLSVVLSLSGTMAQVVAQGVDMTNMLSREDIAGEDIEDLVSAVVAFLDNAGDIASIVLLSGISELLWREDTEAGDVNRQIRGLLQAAVLTGRGDMVFEGSVATTPGGLCIASFPGKYLDEWKALTWLCERQELSSACVFLPLSDPQQRFGKHSLDPDTPGTCWCHQLYGEEKQWGCMWFEAWLANIKKACELDLELVVVFFSGQRDQGVVEWNDLPTSDLWDGVGLGGSQKGETAYLRKMGISYRSEDLATVKAWLASRRQLPEVHTV